MPNSISDRTTGYPQPVHEPPFIERNGLLFYQEACKTPEFLDASLVTTLFDETVVVDHLVLLFANPEALTDFAAILIRYGAHIGEGPGKWPQDFCPDQAFFPDDLAMYFLSAQMPSGVILVLAAPHAANDQLDRLLQERGINTVHHIALRVEDVDRAAAVWRRKGFNPLSPTAQDDGCLCQWPFRNSAGQILELICRRCEGGATFSCQNIAALRLTEQNVK